MPILTTRFQLLDRLGQPTDGDDPGLRRGAKLDEAQPPPRTVRAEGHTPRTEGRTADRGDLRVGREFNHEHSGERQGNVRRFFSALARLNDAKFTLF